MKIRSYLAALFCIVGVSQTHAQDQVELGKSVYMTLCVACHQPTGAGLPPVFPSLLQTEYVSGSPERFAAMILKGVMGPITVKGMVFNNAMPPQEAMLSDEKIAAAITYVRASFGNTYPAVAPEVVTAARAKFADRKTSWTEADLKAWPEAAPAK
jgi:mono/diheme cytochrome c family protein